MNADLLMRRCLNLAALGRGKVSPNPLVGSLIYKDGFIIGEGYHMKYGQAHAEVNAISSVKESDLSGSTLFVNLEPCSHTGKTPPCADLIISKNIEKVYIATEDPNPLVCGNGIQKLISSGISVHLGIMENESRALNKRFITYQELNRPFIILKWAESKNGYIGSESEKVWLSGGYSSRITHKQRAFEDAILIGRKTYQLDKPKLTTRNWPGSDPIRIVIDPTLKNEYAEEFLENAHIISKKDIKISDSVFENDRLNLQKLATELRKLEIQSIIVEGGSETINSFIEENMWDEAWTIKTTAELDHGIQSPSVHLKPDHIIRAGTDMVHITLNPSVE